MRPWVKRTLIALLGATALLGGIAACGHRHAGWSTMSAEDSTKWRGRLIDRVARELALDDAQKQKLGAVFDRLREQRNAFVGPTADPRAELRALVAGEHFDAARAQALVDEKTAALRSGSPQTIAAIAAFYDGLKPEQQQKLREMLERRHRRFS